MNTTPPASRRFAALRSIFLFCLFLSAVLGVLLYVFGVVIPPGMMGVRQITLGLGQGFANQALLPGYHWTVPSYSTVHYIPRTLQLLHFQSDGQGVGALEILTADRAAVDVDLTVLTRFLPSPGEEGGVKHGGPRDLITTIGISAPFWINHVRRTAEDQLKRALGDISTADFYNPDIRERQLEKAKNEMNQILLPDGIKVEGLMLRRYSYREERIDNAIFQKNLQNQEEAMNVAAGNLAQASALVLQAEAEGDAKIETLKVEGQNKSRVLRSEGELHENQKKAEGDLLVAKARAEIDRLRAQVLSSGPGARLYVARQLTPLLGSLKGGIVRDVDPYDLNKWIEKLGATTP